jgi:AraC family cel operon transcriptional repressor
VVIKAGCFDKTPLHTHNYYEIVLITEGEVIHTINKGEERLNEGNLYLIYPNDIHGYRATPKRKAVFYNLAFSREIFEETRELYLAMTGDMELGRSVILPEGLRQSLYQKLRYMDSGLTGVFNISRKDVYSVILLDAFAYLKGQRAAGGAIPQWLSRAMQGIRDSGDFIEEDGLELFLNLADKTQSHINHVMRQSLHTTPTAYINGLRLGEAARQLRGTDKSILNIIFDCGFGNVSYFNKLFRTEFGVSPRSYRKMG